jgi:thiamine-phosphate pyrophosphorylase
MPEPRDGDAAHRHLPIPRRLAAARLYLCTDARRERGDLAEFAEAALAGGVDIIQLRDKGSAGERMFGPLEARGEMAALEILADAAHRHGALFAVNDRADIARAVGADVLHLGQDDLPLPVARDIVGARTVIGRSTHDPVQLHRADSEDVDYFCVGPCWPTPTKPGRPAAGLDLVRAATRRQTGKPWFAIGGIDEQNLAEVLTAGATRVVVVRAITAAEDPGASAARLAAALPATA